MADRFKIISLLLCIPLSLISQGEKYRFETLNVQQGLSNNTITCLLQDQQGFMWIGTADGLNRYDGYTVREYRHDPENFKSLGHNYIRTIYQDPADSGKVLWIGTKGGGLNNFDLESEQFIRYLHDPDEPTSLSDNNVKCIFKDSQGIYWIGTQDGGLNQFDRKSDKFISYQRDYHDPYSLSNNNVTAIREDHLGNLWIATVGGGLNKLMLYNSEIDTLPLTSKISETWTTHPVSEIWEYNPHDSSSENWKKKSNMPTARWGSSACTSDGKIYVVGGISYRKPPDTPSLEYLEAYDPGKDSWERLADMNVPRAGLSANVVNGKIYAIGGYATNYTWGSSGQVVEEYDLVTNTWTRKKDMPARIGDHYAAVLGDKIFVMGGCSSDEFLNPAIKAVKVYDPVTDSWSKRADMKVARTQFASCVMDGKIYVMGGMKAPGSMAGLKSVEVYDPVKNSWKELKEMPGARWGHQTAVVDNKIRVFGGLEKRYQQDTVFEYDPQSDDWRILPAMPVKMAAMSSSLLNGKIYFIGGVGFTGNSVSMKNRKFIRYKVDLFDQHSLPSDYVYSHCEDRQGTLWIGTGEGVCIFDRSSNRFIRHRFNTGFSRMLNSIRVRSIYEDSSGKLWISTQGGGLFQISENRDHLIQYQDELDVNSSGSFNNTSSIVQDRSGVIWLGTIGGGIIKLVPERKKFQHIKHLFGEGRSGSYTKVSSIFNDNSGQLWIGTTNGVLHKFDHKNQIFIQYHFDTNRSIENICGAQNGELWLARGNVLTKFNPLSEKFINFYGLWGPYFTSNPPILYTWVDDLQEQKRLIASINKVGNNQNITRKFEIYKKTKAIIVAQGEAVLNELMDRAWLIEEKNNKILWQMIASQTRHAGGAARNRIQHDSLTLMPGKYQVRYYSNTE
ncbi:MAG: hypothetical protein KAT07_13250, partial [Calditrichia bacterium]|nr:hypothetical protein [Calditrichia bacterium]